jgi:Ran GTPase-activating protein (RanGAP) involved in mRNA processing and transport
MASPDTSRLRHLVALGDHDALRLLLTEATRRDDPALAYAAITAAVAAARVALSERAPSRALDLLCNLPPSQALWDALRALLPRFSGARRAEVIPALSAVLDAGWPDALRVAPSEWLRDPALDALPLARALSVRGALPDDLRALPAALTDAKVTSLTLQPQSMQDPRACGDALTAVLASPALSSLSSLHVHSARPLRDVLGVALRDLPQASGLTHLTLSRCALTADHIGLIARHPRLRSLAHLDLTQNLLDDYALAELLRAPHLDSLVTLDLGDNPTLSPAAGDRFALAPASPCARLTTLGLRGCGLHDDGVIGLTRSSHLAALEILDLSANSIDQAGVRALCRARAFTGLQALSLSNNALRDSSLMALSHWPTLQRLTYLDLSKNRFQPPALSELATSRHVHSLQHLNLSLNGFGDRGLLALAGSPHLSALQTLSLQACGLTDVAAAALLTSPLARRLQSLDLSNRAAARRDGEALAPNRLSPETAQRIAQLPADALPALGHLSLAFTHLSDEGAQALASAPALASLTSLDVRGCGLSPAGALTLLRSPYLQRLQRLALRGNAIGPDVARCLAAPLEGDDEARDGGEDARGARRLGALVDLDADLAELSAEGEALLRASPPLHPSLCESLGLPCLPPPPQPTTP